VLPEVSSKEVVPAVAAVELLESDKEESSSAGAPATVASGAGGGVDDKCSGCCGASCGDDKGEEGNVALKASGVGGRDACSLLLTSLRCRASSWEDRRNKAWRW